jgi:2-polyprenyl-3-methyl-5-hydroxy-6-metoxy-1,4-benzoquinol methylase
MQTIIKKTQPYKINYNCVCCGNSQCEIVLDLNDQPLANSYLKTKDEVEYRYPLKLKYCRLCTHLQQDISVDPDLMFKNYLYVSGTSNTLRQYFKDFVNIVCEYNQGKKILDIACNDGSQLDSFKERGYITHGVDPATNLFELSSKNHKVHCRYFDKEVLDELDKDYDVIIAQNVFAHVRRPLEFLEGCKSILKDGGHIFIQTSQADMVFNNEFDTIYHEHISFFSVKSFSRLVERAGLKLIDVRRTPVHGTSFVFVVSNSGEDRAVDLISKETPINFEVIQEYVKRVKHIKEKLRIKIEIYRQLGYALVGYGAAAKGNTLLNYANLDLDYILDDNPLKHGLFTPGRRIPIKPPSFVALENRKVLLIPLAWNFFDEIKQKVKSIKNENMKYLKYFPDVEVLDA